MMKIVFCVVAVCRRSSCAQLVSRAFRVAVGVPDAPLRYLLRRDRRLGAGALEQAGPDPQLARVDAARAHGRARQPRRGGRHRRDEPHRLDRPGAAPPRPLRPRVPLPAALARGAFVGPAISMSDTRRQWTLIAPFNFC